MPRFTISLKPIYLTTIINSTLALPHRLLYEKTAVVNTSRWNVSFIVQYGACISGPRI